MNPALAAMAALRCGVPYALHLAAFGTFSLKHWRCLFLHGCFSTIAVNLALYLQAAWCQPWWHSSLAPCLLAPALRPAACYSCRSAVRSSAACIFVYTKLPVCSLVTHLAEFAWLAGTLW